MALQLKKQHLQQLFAFYKGEINSSYASYGSSGGAYSTVNHISSHRTVTVNNRKNYST